MIDSHCHLADAQFTDLDAVLQRAAEAGVDRCITIADTLAEARKCVALAESYRQLFCTVGVHPHAAKEWTAETGEELERMVAAHPRVRAIGEIGLDYHYNFSPPDVQGAVFASQVALANRVGLPAVVHCREAVEDVWAIVREYPDFRMVLHCCTEKWEDVERFVDQGHFLSFTGIATYANAEVVRDTIKHCPLEKLMIETDSPYLAPIPYRGKRNEPAFVAEVLKAVAEIKGIELAEADRIITENTVGFFGLPS
jgi:TatD DNase family protein